MFINVALVELEQEKYVYWNLVIRVTATVRNAREPGYPQKSIFSYLLRNRPAHASLISITGVENLVASIVYIQAYIFR